MNKWDGVLDRDLATCTVVLHEEKPRDVDNICNRTPLANATIYTTCFVRYDFRISRWDFTLTS